MNLATPTLSKSSLTQPASSSGFLSGMVIGTALGATGHFLLATPKGKEVMSDLVDFIREELRALDLDLPFTNPTTTKLSPSSPTVSNPLNNQDRSPIPTQESLTLSIEDAKRQAGEMQASLKLAATQLEKKFFMRRGHSLKK